MTIAIKALTDGILQSLLKHVPSTYIRQLHFNVLFAVLSACFLSCSADGQQAPTAQSPAETLYRALHSQRLWGPDFAPIARAYLWNWAEINRETVTVLPDREVGMAPFSSIEHAEQEANVLLNSILSLSGQISSQHKPGIVIPAADKFKVEVIYNYFPLDEKPRIPRVAIVIPKERFLAPGLTMDMVVSELGKPDSIEQIPLNIFGEGRMVILTKYHYAEDAVIFIETNIAPRSGLVNRVVFNLKKMKQIGSGKTGANAAKAKPLCIDMASDDNDKTDERDSEPSIAVYPDPKHVNDPDRVKVAVVAFSGGWGPIQATSEVYKAVIWKSDDGGRHWRKVRQMTQPLEHFDGPYDQKIAFDAQGRLLVAVMGAIDPFNRRLFILRQARADRPDEPMKVGQAYGGVIFNKKIIYPVDQPQLDIDRSKGHRRRNRLYSPWLSTLDRFRANVAVSRSRGIRMHNIEAGNDEQGNRTTRIALAPNGRAYIVYKMEGFQIDDYFEYARFIVQRSDNGGRSWNALYTRGKTKTRQIGVPIHSGDVITYATKFFGKNPHNPKSMGGRCYSSDAWIAVDPGTGYVYVAYVRKDKGYPGCAQIFVARSTDRGRHWTSFRVTDRQRNSAYPEIAVAANGTVGVLYIDFDASGEQTVFRHCFAASYSNGTTWNRKVLQEMKLEELSNAANELWGDYEGLTAAGNYFYGAFTGKSICRKKSELDPIFFREPAFKH